MGFSGSYAGKESACNAGRSSGEGIGYPLQYSRTSLAAQMVKNLLACGRPGFDSWVGKIPWRRAWQPTPELQYACLENPHGQRSLVGYSPWGHKELDTTEWLNIAQHKLDVPVQFSSVTQSCLTLCNPMDCSTPGLPVHQQLPEFNQTHVHWVSAAIWIPILYCPLLLPPSMSMRASQVVLVVKNLCANAGDLRDTDLLPG